MKLTVANPCHEDWNAMTGCERKRFCDHCEKSVHDLSEMTEDEATALLAQPGVCARYRVGPDGHVRFKGQRATAAALVLSAVFASAPAIAGGKAANPDAQGWGDWLVEWIAGGEEEPVMLGLVLPEPVAPPTPVEPEYMELMGDVAEVVPDATELRTVENATSETLHIECNGEVQAIPAGVTVALQATPGSHCTMSGGGLFQSVWEREVRCAKGPKGTTCE